MKAKWTGTGKEPKLAHHDDAGFDLSYHGDQPIAVQPNTTVNIPTGVHVQLPENTWGMITGRSSTFVKRHLITPLGVIDNGFRGELFAIVHNIGTETQTIEPDERIAQLIVMPMLSNNIEWSYSDKLDESIRGESGFGSTGS